MIGSSSSESRLQETILDENVPGDLIETEPGGGACIYMRAMLGALNTDKTVCGGLIRGAPSQMRAATQQT